MDGAELVEDDGALTAGEGSLVGAERFITVSHAAHGIPATAHDGGAKVPRAGGDGEPLGTLGDYTLRREIGRGGMGVVYDAWQNSMDRRVALKVLPPGIAADTKTFTRFCREANREKE